MVLQRGCSSGTSIPCDGFCVANVHLGGGVTLKPAQDSGLFSLYANDLLFCRRDSVRMQIRLNQRLRSLVPSDLLSQQPEHLSVSYISIPSVEIFLFYSKLHWFMSENYFISVKHFIKRLSPN